MSAPMPFWVRGGGGEPQASAHEGYGGYHDRDKRPRELAPFDSRQPDSYSGWREAQGINHPFTRPPSASQDFRHSDPYPLPPPSPFRVSATPSPHPVARRWRGGSDLKASFAVQHLLAEPCYGSAPADTTYAGLYRSELESQGRATPDFVDFRHRDPGRQAIHPTLAQAFESCYLPNPPHSRPSSHVQPASLPRPTQSYADWQKQREDLQFANAASRNSPQPQPQPEQLHLPYRSHLHNTDTPEGSDIGCDADRDLDGRLLSDDEAVSSVTRCLFGFNSRNPASRHARILLALIHPKTAGAEFELDNCALESIFLAANEIFFNGRLTHRVRWGWSKPGSNAEYDGNIIGHTALRKAKIGGFETFILLSTPILCNPEYNRRLLISAFLHELIHCYLFICCGWSARKSGGHTDGFRAIANMIDEWAGREHLHLCHVEADLERFRQAPDPVIEQDGHPTKGGGSFCDRLTGCFSRRSCPQKLR
ncbi:hypothetical protein CMQ_5563 [Grosmannia clavigera kw1407]|uniref:SprT-like domain-containing protein n=1 Tax=Grosmannia clavigera (strain kw1407 / UAMH 11150) TaxID=655863 RepID=F0XT34_GROCL|nr:uncharacterized protein CMQ_5563 [Grosmannia clavigera kw1407]EFW99142.1 hypothetical protein CMQ_5563 [Grosmannia clavigera kw1407]